MQLRHPTQAGTASQSADDLQHAAAMRVQARIDAAERKQASRESAKAFKNFFSIVLMLGVLALGFWAWKSGLLDSALEKKSEEQKQQLGDLYEAAPAKGAAPTAEEAKGTGAQILDRVKKVAQDVASAVGKGAAEPVSAAAVAARFEGAAIDYWKNAVAEDKPGKDRSLLFTGLVPKEGGSFDLLEIEMGGGRFAVKRVGAAGQAEEIDKAGFNKLIAKTPYLVVREGRAYYCSAGRVSKPDFYKVPAKGGALNPSRDEFGALADCLAAVKTKTPTFRYKATLVLENLKKELEVATVGYGEEIPRAAFEKAAHTLLDDAEMCETFLAAGKVRIQSVK